MMLFLNLLRMLGGNLESKATEELLWRENAVVIYSRTDHRSGLKLAVVLKRF